MSNNDTTTTPANSTTPAMTGTLDYAVRNGILVSPPADFPYREKFMEIYGHRTFQNYPLTAWEVAMFQAVWLMPEDVLKTICNTHLAIRETLGEDGLSNITDDYSDPETIDGFISLAEMIFNYHRPGDVTPAGKENPWIEQGTAVTQPEEVMA